MNLEALLNKAITGDEQAFVALKTIFGHQELKIVDLGNKNKRLCDGIRDVLANRDFRTRMDHTVQESIQRTLLENEFIPRP